MAQSPAWSEIPLTEWDAAVADAGAGGDVYFSREYHEASALLEPGDASCLLLGVAGSGGTYLLPLLVRSLPDGAGFDATSAYGYGGPVVLGDPDALEVREGVDDWARSRGVVATFLRSHPLARNAAHFPAGSSVDASGSTVGWKLLPEDDIVAGMHPHHRRMARRAERAGVEVSVQEHPADLSTFRRLYETTMRRQNASPYYFFPDAYWRALEGSDDVSVLVVEGVLGGEPVASLLCLHRAGVLHYHLGATADAGRSTGASHLCFAAAAAWGQRHDVRLFHLGGGLSGAASTLHTFKRRFDPDGPEFPFHIGKLVHDQQHYRALTGGDSVEGFFPPWRAPA